MSLPHQLGGSIPCRVNAKKMNNVARASPRSSADDVRKLSLDHHLK